MLSTFSIYRQRTGRRFDALLSLVKRQKLFRLLDYRRSINTSQYLAVPSFPRNIYDLDRFDLHWNCKTINRWRITHTFSFENFPLSFPWDYYRRLHRLSCFSLSWFTPTLFIKDYSTTWWSYFSFTFLFCRIQLRISFSIVCYNFFLKYGVIDSDVDHQFGLLRIVCNNITRRCCWMKPRM